MDIRSPRNRRAARHGGTAVYVAVILVPVVAGLMGFAVDLGRLYSARHDLKVAANAAALAAAQRLMGTENSREAAAESARLTLGTTYGNRYDLAMLAIGGDGGFLASQIEDPTFYETAVDAKGEAEGSGNEAGGGTTARHVRVVVDGETPLVFWGLLSLGQERKITVRAQAVAGVSAPLCTACGIEPLAIAAVDAGDTTHFGFTPNTKYTLGYLCTGLGNPGALQGTSVRIPYLIMNRLNTDAQIFADPGTQLYRIGAQGLPTSTNAALGCMQIAGEEQVWENAGPANCNQNVASQVTAFVCGLAARFDSAVPAACANVAEVDSAAQAYRPDTDLADIEDYSAYTGNGRRLITLAIVETLNGTGTNTVLGFRQFLVDPNQNDTTVNPSDNNARFVALYVGSVAPVRQGHFNGCAQQASGPGKVVLFQ